MKRELFLWELKKLWAQPMLPVFLALCLLANGLTAAGEHSHAVGSGEYPRYVAAVTETIGGRMGAAFDAALAALQGNAALAEAAGSSRNDCHAALTKETFGAQDTLQSFDTSVMAAAYESLYGVTGTAVDLLDAKYAAFQASVDELAARDASLDLAAAGCTKAFADTLFATQCRLLITEALIFAALAALYLTGCENLSRTGGIYATCAGRRGVGAAKFWAGMASALGAYAVLCAVSLAVFVAIWRPWGALWQASVSSQFNCVQSALSAFPFLTWRPMSFAGYLAATAALGAVLVPVFYLPAFAAGLWLADAYRGFLAFAALLAANFGLMLLAGDVKAWLAYLALQFTPVGLWLNQPQWFTDGGVNTVLPWQECWAAVLCLAVGGAALALAARRFAVKSL